jgi:preprotein translocase subunit YajC
MAEALQPFLMFIPMAAIIYFLIIRPQNKRAKEHRDMVEALKRGDEIVTQGGLVGKIAKVSETEATVELAEGVKVRVIKSTIVDIRNRTEPKPANDSAS